MRGQQTASEEATIGDRMHAREKVFGELGQKAAGIAVTNAESFCERATIYLLMGSNDLALADLDEAVKRWPGRCSAYVMRGKLLGELGHRDKALADFERAIAISPTNAAAYFWRGGLLYRLREYDHAIEDLTTAVRLDPTDARYETLCEVARRAKRHYTETLAEHNRLLASNPDSHQLYLARGQLHYVHGNAREAITDLSKAIEMESNDPDAYLLRARAWNAVNETERAREDVDRCRALGGTPDADLLKELRMSQ